MDEHARQTQKTEQIVYTARVLLNHIITPTALKRLRITLYKYYVQIFFSLDSSSVIRVIHGSMIGSHRWQQLENNHLVWLSLLRS